MNARITVPLDLLIAPKLGEHWKDQGGILGALMRGQNGEPDYYLILATDPLGEHEPIEFGGYGQNTKGAASESDGAANTLALVRSKTPHPAAEWAHGLVIDGHADWYLPARRELRALSCTVPEFFRPEYHWTSTQSSAHSAWCQGFASGYQYYWGKDNELRARVVRRLLAY
jgi:hypothetical protein